MTMRSVPALLNLAADRDPDAPAITCDTETVTRSELRERTNRMARAFAELGVRTGSFVTIALPNSVAFLEACVASWKLGAVPQPVSHRLPDRERQAIVELADSALVVGADPDAHPTRNVLAPGWQPDPGLSPDDLPEVVSPTWKAPTSGGSTGRPKLILSGAGAEFDDAGPGSIFGIYCDGAVAVPGPLYHNAGFMVSSLGLFGGNHVAVLPKFDALATLEMIDQHRIGLVLLVPTMMSRIVRLPEAERARFDLSSLTRVWHMAAPCPLWCKWAWIDWLGAERIYELYGGTEGQAYTIIPGDEWVAHPGSVGRVAAGEMRVLDPDTHEERPVGEMGEVFMRTTALTPTYQYVGAEAHRIADGWESLGDMGWFDADGYLFLGDRKSDMILSGGANIYPAEVESALAEHPAVLSSAVIGLPDDDLGKRIHAVVQVDPVVGVTGIDEDELRRFLGERIVRYKVPRSFEFTIETVRDDAGKVRRSALVAERRAPSEG
jgi:bile acid-coenzyme A ligase